MEIDCLYVATCTAQRLAWLEKSIDFLQLQGFPFKTKIISVYSKGSGTQRTEQLHRDTAAGRNSPDLETVPESLAYKLKQAGWLIKYSSNGRAQALSDCLSLMDSEFVFYNEEDILVKLPTLDDLISILNVEIGGKTCGMVSLNLGGSDHDFPKQKFGDLLDIRNNILLQNSSYLCFRRLESKRSEWFVEFPALFIRKSLFQNLLDLGAPKFGIEQALTANYFAQKCDQLFFKASFCKPNVFDVVEWYKTNFNLEMFESAKLIRLLDAGQGFGVPTFNLNQIPEL